MLKIMFHCPDEFLTGFLYNYCLTVMWKRVYTHVYRKYKLLLHTVGWEIFVWNIFSLYPLARQPKRNLISKEFYSGYQIDGYTYGAYRSGCLKKPKI